MASTSKNYDIYRPLTDAEIAEELEKAVREIAEFRELHGHESGEEEDDQEIFSAHNTDTEESSESDNEEERITEVAEFFLGKDKVSKWEKQPPTPSRTRRHNIITHPPGCVGVAQNITDCLEAFNIYFDDEIIECLVQNTNIFIQLKIRDKYARDRDARDTNQVEMRALLGLLIMSGVLRGSHLNYKDLFAQGDIGHHFFSSVMTYNRFLFLLTCLRFDDVRTRGERVKTDKLAAIRYVFDNIVEKCKTVFRPSEYVTIDEQLVAFRGKCNFRQYIPSKPNKYGIKVFALVDARNFYCANMEIYAGKQPEGQYALSNTPEEIVCRLIGPITQTGRNVTVDNWYTSIPLATRLLRDHKLTLVGTLKKNKREIPPEFQADRNKSVNSSIFGFTKDMSLVSYIPRKSKAVLLLSTMHNDNAIDPTTQDAKKPEILTFYNMTKGGVDTNDKLCATYNVGRRTRRWPVVIFFHLINVVAINARVICISNSENVTDRSLFLKQLAYKLVKPLQIHRSQDSHIPRSIRTRIREELNLPAEPVPDQPAGQRRRCHFCPWARNRSSRQVCVKCNRNACGEHLRNICVECLQGYED